MGILKPTAYEVRQEGTLVVLKLGNAEIRMDHKTALDIAQHMRVKGRRAKAMAGDTSMNLSALALLSDAEGDELERQKLKEF